MDTLLHPMKIDENTQKSKESYHRKNPYPARFISSRRLNKPGSTKETLHVVLDLENSGIDYRVGSSFGIYPENNPFIIDEILSLLGCDPLIPIFDKRSGGTFPLRLFLRDKVNFSQITSQHIKVVHSFTQNSVLQVLLDDKDKLRAFLEGNNLLSFVASFWDPKVPIQDFIDILSPLLPRFYSIASSSRKVGSEIHLLVASFSYMHAGRLTHSVTAQYLHTYCSEGESRVRLFLQDNPNFTLPEDPNTPIIMIGPGTGLAAFRGFIQEREITKVPGKTWLFTGDRERKYDFYYEEEFIPLVEEGLLRLSTAFSRDGPKKVYVQDRMQEEGKDLWDWITKEKATLYISGDAKQMAKDVQATLITIAMTHGNLCEESAKEFFKELRLNKQLLLDIY
jgi:sulfite reductase (NADPH) flavoprotein alpha-component